MAELLPPSEPPPGAPPAPEAPAPEEAAPDVGAQAARRTVKYRKPRQEHFPLVGRSPEALRARRDLLVALSESAQDGPKARLLVAAAEICEQLGEADDARDLYVRAHEADRADVIVLRALRREAMLRGDHAEVATLLEAETALPLSPADRASAYTLLAETQLRQLGDASAAERSARAASELRKESLVAALLLAEARAVQRREAEATAALERAAEVWSDATGRAALYIEVARALERQGQAARALERYRNAVESDAGALDGWIGVARCARATGDVDAAVEALVRASSLLGDGPPAEGLRRLAARLLHVVAKKPEDALILLDGARNVASLKARADAAAAVGDGETRVSAVEAWAQATGETERALALVHLAELRAEAGDLDGADAALRDAALADSNLGTVQVVREVLARRAGDSSRLARAVEASGDGPGASMVAAARIARDPTATARERELLARAVEEGEAPVTADVLSLDAAGAAGDGDSVRAGLRRQADRAAPERKVGPLLLLADAAARAGDLTAALELLREARDVSPGDPLVLRPLGRLIAPNDAREAAAVWLEEASSATGERAAHAALAAGRLLSGAGTDPTSAFRRALDLAPTYAPAAWALEPRLREAQDVAGLADLHERLAELVDGRLEVAGRLIRAALLRGAEDPPAAAALLDKARAARPDDVILYDLMLRLGDGMSPAERGALLAASAANAPPDLARSARLRAAAAFELAGDPAQAASLYREVLADTDGADPIALRSIDRAEIAAGEHARVADRRFHAVKEATDDEARVHALERMADFDLAEREDPSSAMLSLQSILEVAPGHVPSLRALERHFMNEARDDDLLPVEEKLAEHLTPGTDVTAHARLATRLLLRPPDAPGDAADGVLLGAADRGVLDLWLARRVTGAAAAARDGVILSRALSRMVDLLSGPAEQVAAALVAADALDATGDVAAAAALLGRAHDAAPSHPTAGEELARLRHATGDARGAAEAFEAAARAARVPRRAASLWYRVGKIWQDDVADPDRALEALVRAGDLAPTYLDVFDRIERLLTERGETRRLADLTERRIQEGGEPAVLVGLYLGLAKLREELGQPTAAKEALRAALALEPERVDALRRLSDLSLQGEDWRGAAEALIKIARLRKDRDELRWVFFTLGDIYDTHMPDPRRAEAAFRRVLKLVPDDTEAMERLAELYRREGNTAAAAEMLQQLAQHEVDPDRNRDYQLRLAASLESQGDLRQAEAVLEHTRRKSPTDLEVLRAMAEFYQRQNAHSAQAMHLGRAIADFRQAIARDASDASLWPGLVEVLGWRGVADAARCCASAAYAIGVTDVELSRHVDAHGGIPGGGGAACDPGLDDTLSPPTLTRATRAVFHMAGEALEKALPFDLRAFQADRLPREHGFKNAMLEVGRWFGVPDMQVYQTYQAPRVCVAVSSSPVTVLVGGDLLTLTDEHEKIFLLARAVKVARANLAVAVRSQPAQLALAVAGLVRSYDPRYAPHGLDSDQVDEMAHRVSKHVHRRVRDDLFPLAMEMSGAPGFDPARLGLAASELGDRVALLATGSVPAAIGSLLKLASSPGVSESTPAGRVQAIRQVPEALSLLEFATSDTLFEARSRVGADRL